MRGPVRAVGRQIQRREVDDVDSLANLSEPAREPALAGAGGLGSELVKGGQKQLLGDDGRTSLVGVIEGVAPRGPGTANHAEDYGVDVGPVAQVVDAKVVRGLGEDHDDRVAAAVEGPCVAHGAVPANKLATGMPWNVIANLLQNGMVRGGYVDVLVMRLSSDGRLLQSNQDFGFKLGSPFPLGCLWFHVICENCR